MKIGIGYARRGSNQEKRFNEGQATDKLEVDISFKEPVGAIQVVKHKTAGTTFRAYSLLDLIAEKLRALLQQEKRNRYRRQDIYDLDALLTAFTLDAGEQQRLLDLLRMKSEARNITPELGSLEQPETIRRAKEDWDSLKLELGEVPDFDACFTRVNEFYRKLPW